MSGPGLKSKKVRLLLCYSLHYPQSPRIISPSEGLMWLLGLQNQNEKTGGFETGPSGDGRLTEHREPPFFFLACARSRPLEGAPLKCPFDSIPHYLASLECQLTRCGRGEAEKRIWMDWPREDKVFTEGRVSHSLKVRWLRPSPELRGSVLIKGCVVSLKDNKPMQLSHW